MIDEYNKNRISVYPISIFFFGGKQAARQKFYINYLQNTESKLSLVSRQHPGN